MYQDLPFLVLMFAIFFVVNYLIHRAILQSATEKHIKPFVNSKGMNLSRVVSAGLINTGDFPKREFNAFVPKFGGITLETYVYVYAATPEKREVRFTAKIVTVFLIIKKVEFKGLE